MTGIVLPWPPSNNTYYRRVGAKTLISAKGRDYCAAVIKACAEARISMQDGRLADLAECGSGVDVLKARTGK